MKIDIGNKNKIKNSSIGKNNKIVKDEQKNYALEIVIGIVVTVIGGIILYLITKKSI